MKKNILITIGIPAFNEEANIKVLLDDILSQKTDGFEIAEVIVASDNSTDRTDAIVEEFKNKKVKLIKNEERKGQAERQNQIIRAAIGDILVLLNADIRIKDKNSIAKLIDPILSGKADLTSCDPRPLKPQGFVEHILHTSIKIKKEMFENYNSGNNVYTCHGRVRGFSKKLYKKIRFEKSVGEDAFSYFFAIKNAFTYQFVPGTYILYRLPNTFSDHKKQSIRFIQTRKLLTEHFGKDLVEKEYHLPKVNGIKSVTSVALRDPFRVGMYISVFGAMRILSLFSDMSSNTWSVSKSSKNLKG